MFPIYNSSLFNINLGLVGGFNFHTTADLRNVAAFTKTFNLWWLLRYFTNKQMSYLVWFDIFYLFIA